MLIDFLIMAAKNVGANKFEKYMQEIKRNRIENNQWCPSLDLNEDSLHILRPLSFK